MVLAQDPERPRHGPTLLTRPVGRAEDMTCGQSRMLRISSSGAWVRMISESRISLEWTAWARQIGLVAADAGHQDRACECARARRWLCGTYANSDPSQVTAANRPSRRPLARIRRRSPVLRTGFKPSRLRPPRWTRSRSRPLKPSTRSLAGCRSPPSVKLTPKSLFHRAESQCDRLARPHGVMSSDEGVEFGGVRVRELRRPRFFCPDPAPPLVAGAAAGDLGTSRR